MTKTFTGGRDLSARVYDVLCRWSERHGLLEAREDLVGDLTGDVVEIGAGTGLNFEHYPPGATVLASDYDPVMLRRARPRGVRARARVALHVADAQRLPLADGSVDTVVVGLMLCSVPEPGRVIDELKRILRPGGRVRFVEHVRAEDGTRLSRIQDLTNPLWRLISGGCNANRRTADAIAAAGFEITELRRFRIGRTHVSPHVLGTAVRP